MSKIGGFFGSPQDLKNVRTLGFKEEVDNGNSGTEKTIDWNAGQKQKLTLNGNVVLTFTDPSHGVGMLQLKLVQDATGGRTVTFPASVKWAGGSAPTLTSDGGGIDIITLFWDGTNYFSQSALNFV